MNSIRVFEPCDTTHLGHAMKVIISIPVCDAIINACMVEFIPSLIEHLALPKPNSDTNVVMPSKSSKWKKLRGFVKTYLTDFLRVRVV